jgi:hypothetical protein
MLAVIRRPGGWDVSDGEPSAAPSGLIAPRVRQRGACAPRYAVPPLRGSSYESAYLSNLTSRARAVSTVASQTSSLQSAASGCPIPLASTDRHWRASRRYVEARGGGRRDRPQAPRSSTRSAEDRRNRRGGDGANTASLPATHAKRSNPTKWASPSSRVQMLKASYTPGSAALHPELRMRHPLRGFSRHRRVVCPLVIDAKRRKPAKWASPAARVQVIENSETASTNVGHG